MEFDDIQKMVFYEYVENGYLEMWNKGNKKINNIAELGLITTEVAEAIECIRENKSKDELELELADIIIRVLNFASRHNIKLRQIIINKHMANIFRGKLHGKQV